MRVLWIWHSAKLAYKLAEAKYLQNLSIFVAYTSFMILRLISLRRIITPLLFLLCLTAIFPASAQPTCPTRRIVPERLPDLNIPRSGHSIFYANGELTVVGGHTTGFVPTLTAEYYDNGAWHTMSMVYSHDNGFAVILHSDEFLIGGGHDEELGLGQTFTLERYNPTTHSFEGFSCLDKRRVLANATQLSDGRIIISGNHYADDAIAYFDENNQVQHIKDVAQGRSNPYILPIAPDNALIISGSNLHMNHPDTIWADHLKGDAFRVPLLEQWQPVFTDQPFNSGVCSMGDELHGEYAYLLAATDKSGQLGIVVMCDTTFSLLPTVCPIPMNSSYGPIFYKGPVVIDKPRQRGYIVGVDSICRHQFVLAIDFSQHPAELTLFQTDSLEHATVAIPIMTPDGDLILAGGNPEDNYNPLSTVWLYHFGSTPDGQASEQAANLQSIPLWLWILLTIIVLLILTHYLYRKRKHAVVSSLTSNDQQPTDEELMQRICQTIERDRQYLTSRLRLSDIAVELGVSVTALTDCIQSQRHCTFAQLVAEYRVHYAQQLLSEHPDMKLNAVIAESGFTSESTFFRSFKAVTGLSPKEWLAQSAKLE